MRNPDKGGVGVKVMVGVLLGVFVQVGYPVEVRRRKGNRLVAEAVRVGARPEPGVKVAVGKAVAVALGVEEYWEVEVCVNVGLWVGEEVKVDAAAIVRETGDSDRADVKPGDGVKLTVGDRDVPV
jgi:hypothetical protein